MANAVKVSRRLRALADQVVAGRPAADIGTDHGLLPAHLIASGRTPYVIATEVGIGPLARARHTLARLGHDVDLRHGDGLTVLAPGEVSTVVVAGMGGLRIRSIVDASAEVVDRVDRLVLQPMTGWARMRAWIARRDWTLVDERMVCEAGEHHLVLVIAPRPSPATRAWTDDDLELGPRLRRRRDPAWCAWVRWRLGVCRRALAQAHAGLGPSDARLGRLHAAVATLERLGT
jgi:tRNA (adenine22-N1)-methyltransferase